jgi:hypothetical protein
MHEVTPLVLSLSNRPQHCQESAMCYVYNRHLSQLHIYLCCGLASDTACRLNQRQLLQQPLPATTVPAAAAAAAAPTCTTIRDTQLQTGALCISQLATTTTKEVLCDRYEPGCVKSTVKTAVLSPSGDALSNPVGFQQSADAACKVLGYATAGSGSVHMTGANAKRTCW